jgi:hypothetical protein
MNSSDNNCANTSAIITAIDCSMWFSVDVQEDSAVFDSYSSKFLKVNHLK